MEFTEAPQFKSKHTEHMIVNRLKFSNESLVIVLYFYIFSDILHIHVFLYNCTYKCTVPWVLTLSGDAGHVTSGLVKMETLHRLKVDS